MVSISGCDPLDPGSNPGTAKVFCCLFQDKKVRQPGVEPGAKAWEASMLPIHHWRM